jgi:hypothetical protein
VADRILSCGRDHRLEEVGTEICVFSQATFPSPSGRRKKISTFGEKAQPLKKLMVEEVFWTDFWGLLDDLADWPMRFFHIAGLIAGNPFKNGLSGW